MFENYSLWQIIQMGGVTMYILIGCSVLVVGVVLERFITLLRMRSEGAAILEKLRQGVRENNVSAVSELSKSGGDVISSVLAAGFREWGKEERVISAAMEREIGVQTVRMEKYVGILGTVGSVAVYIGLFGTVVGIMRAMHDIGQFAMAGGWNAAITGVAEALVCTAMGLMVAVPSVVAYNYFVRRINVIVAEMELAASELLALAAAKGSATT